MDCFNLYWLFWSTRVKIKITLYGCFWKNGSFQLKQSRHTVVSCSPRNLGRATASVYFTGVKKTPFSRICSSALPEQKHTKFFVWIPSGWVTSNSKFELNPPSRSRDTRLQSSYYFLRIFLLLFATLFAKIFVAVPHWNKKLWEPKV